MFESHKAQMTVWYSNYTLESLHYYNIELASLKKIPMCIFGEKNVMIKHNDQLQRNMNRHLYM